MYKTIATCVAIGLTFAWVTTAGATLLTYEVGRIGNMDTDLPSYGDNVTHPDAGSPPTGAAGGDTPNITVDNGGAGTWDNAGDDGLNDSGYLYFTSNPHDVTLTASAGVVRLEGFLFGAGAPDMEGTVSVSVDGGSFTPIRSGSIGVGVTETYAGLNYTGTNVVVRVDITQGAVTNLAFDDIQFSSIPEPSSLVLAVLGLVAFFARRKRRR